MLFRSAPLTVEDTLETRDGQLNYITTLFPLFDEAGNVRAIGSIAHDITERTQAERALRENENYLRTILQTTADGFWVINRQGQVVDVNEAYCAMSGYTRAELIGMGIANLDAVETPDVTAARIRRIVARGHELFETRHRRKDGSVFPVEISTTYVEEKGGLFVCFCRDLTERVRTEQVLRASEEKFRGLVEQAQAGIWSIDAGGHTTYVNPRMPEALG